MKMSQEFDKRLLKNHSYPGKIVFFDGYCILCNGFVDFLLKVDKKQILSFASLQGETAKNVLSAAHTEKTDSVIFKGDQNSISVKSGAVINILFSLGGLWKISRYMRFIPANLLDYIYDFIAKNRFKWFGKRNACRIPNESEKGRILP
jgi:predicted DCC family thiol-disulfide oxidoreductase YuxK